MTETYTKTFAFRPLADRVVIQRAEPLSVSKGGILLPDTAVAKEKPVEGTVVAVGPGRILDAGPESGWRIEPVLKAGDRVLFAKYAGADIKIGDVEYVVLREDDVLGVMA